MEPAGTVSSDFITALLSHDISNYNQTSRGYLEMLLGEQIGPLTEEQARIIAICLRQTSRIQNLIESVRLLVELGWSAPDPRVMDLDEVIERAIEQVQNDYSEQEVRVHFVAARRKVKAETTLDTVFRHLLSNSVRHNDSEIVEVSLSLATVEEPAPLWRILITDNGNGVPPARRENLFGRLSTGQVHGSGIGLPLVKVLVERWGGQIWLESSEEGKGATFGLTLPRA